MTLTLHPVIPPGAPSHADTRRGSEQRASGHLSHPTRRTWRALGTYVHLGVADANLADEAAALATAVLDAVDAACSRFRPDSDLVRANQAGGQWVSVSPLLVGAIRVALRAAHSTDGLVDPTLGELMVAAGYDRTFTQIRGTAAAHSLPTPINGAWADVRVEGTRVRVPPGVCLDLGATGKAYAADLVALTLVERLGVAAVVSVGGDVRAHAPEGAEVTWPVDLATDLRAWSDNDPGVCRVSLTVGGLATSSITARRWVRAGSAWHHVMDPRTGRPAQTPWLAVTAYGACAADANTATTAALVLGDDAPAWLADHSVAARLVAADGSVCRTPTWPIQLEEPHP